MNKSWRDLARPIIAQAIAEAIAQGLDEKATRKHVSEAYPFGERAMHPYKIWLSEVKHQLAISFARREMGIIQTPLFGEIQA